MPEEKPPSRPRAQRIADARRRLSEDADCWVATAGPAGPWLVPLSPVQTDDGRLWLALVSGTSATARNLAADPTVRLGFGHTRDVVMVDGTAEVVPLEAIPPEVVETYRRRHDSDLTTWAECGVAVTVTGVQAWREENELRGRTLLRDGRWLD